MLSARADTSSAGKERSKRYCFIHFTQPLYITRAIEEKTHVRAPTVLNREKGKTEKVTTQILDLSYRVSLVEISSARVSSSSLRKLRVEFFLFLSNFSDP